MANEHRSRIGVICILYIWAMNKFPELSTERLLLRQFQMSDKDVIQKLCSDKEIAATTLSIPHPFRLADAEEWLKNKKEDYREAKEIAWAICLKKSSHLIGAIGMRLEPKHDSAELGFWVGKSYWGNGYVTEAGKEVVQYSFNNLGLHRLEAHHMVGNEASGRVLEKLGMKYEGLHRGKIKKWKKFRDIKSFALLKSDL